MDTLESAVRLGDASDELVLLLRGGVDTPAKLLRQTGLLASRFTDRGAPAWGISPFAAASNTDELAVLAAKMGTTRSTVA